jgi:hypothetical protein
MMRIAAQLLKSAMVGITVPPLCNPQTRQGV